AGGRSGTKMLGWATEGGLSGDEITLLVGFIRGWDEPAPDLAAVSADRGDVRVGAALYRANCSACHGPRGEGGIGNSLNSPTFLAVASDAFLRDTIVQGRPNTAMPSWRRFDGQELSDLLAFIRTWESPRSDVATAVALCGTDDATTVSAAIGATLYKANCVMCHGVDGTGDLAPSLNTQAFLTVVSDTYLADTLISGRPDTGMPSWRHLPNEDISSLILFLRTWQRQPARSQAWHDQVVPRGDWDAGRALFAGHCAACHGTDGEGATGPQLNNPVFLRTASDVMLREWIRNGKEGTAMRPFRKGGQGITELTDRQIEDIVAYLRRLERMPESNIVRVAKSPHGRPEKGGAIYANNCSGCHGEYGQGGSGPALANAHFLRYASDGFLMATMALGRRGTEMRPVKRGPQSILGLSSDEVNDLVALLRSWEYDPPTPPRPRLAGTTVTTPAIAHRHVIPWNLAQGKTLFESNCAGCHGVEGRGSWAPELNNEEFLAAATDGFLQATIVRGRRGTAMRPFGQGANGLTDLSSQAIDDIVAYIRSWSTRVPSPMTIPAERSRTIAQGRPLKRIPPHGAKRRPPRPGQLTTQTIGTGQEAGALAAARPDANGE
ncbi:MAG: c-type cytochrome, partial [Phycisphaerae bacterium]